MADNIKPNEVVLRFWSKESKDAFLGQLSDGWGENICNFNYEFRDENRGKDRDVVGLNILCFWDPSVDVRRGEGDAWYRDENWYSPDAYAEYFPEEDEQDE